jgi:hypothetical protein
MSLEAIISKPEGTPSKITVKAGPWDSPAEKYLSIALIGYHKWQVSTGYNLPNRILIHTNHW